MWSRRLLRRVRRAGCGVADGSVVIGWIDNGATRGEFTQSLLETIAVDAAGERRVIGYYRQVSGVNVAGARNLLAAEFLNHPERPEWLFMPDADMGWTPVDFYRLLDIADAEHRPIVGGVCVGHEPIDRTGWDYDTFLTVYTVDMELGPRRWSEVPDDTLIRVDATGAAFLLVHRSVFETLKAARPDRHFWAFEEGELTYGDGQVRAMGEDTMFCLRAKAAGFPVHVHSGVVPSHHKGPLVLDMARHRATQQVSKTTVIVPVKDNLAMTSRMMTGLLEQGGWDRVLVMDNGSDRKTRNWLKSQRWFETYDCEGWSIHDMWNAGIDESLTLHPRVNICFLNNDLVLGPRFLPGLTEALRSDPGLLAVCPNYDLRRGPKNVLPVRGIAAGREDGTGGLAGFAFMVRGEWFRQSGYRFPTEAKWWFGDTDLAMTIEAVGGMTAVVRDTTVVHLNGGSQTERPEWWDDQIKQDEAWFWGKWGEHIHKLEVAE
jgi:GT2 family glycosyltransferase